MLRTFLLAALFVISSLSGSEAQSVLTNGGFEQSPPNKYGNNINWSIAPWVLGAGQTNVVSVDGPGGQTWYGNLGPESDATGGAGNMQHYFDQANISGMGIISQEFTPKCTGEVKYGTYFSSRSGATGRATVSILDENGTIVSGPASVTVPRGNSEKDPWQLAAFTASLTANTTYTFQVGMDNELNMDNAYVTFETECDAHQPPCFLDGSCDEPKVRAELKKTCKPATRAADGSWALSCKIDISAEKPFPPQTVVYDKFSIGGNLAQLAITSATSSDPWTCRHSAVVPNSATEFACVMNAADMPASGQSSIDVTLTLPAGSETADIKNCTDGKYSATANSGRIDESCVAIEFEKTPKPDQTAAMCTPFKQGASQCNANTGGTIITLTNTALQSFNPKNIRIVSMTPGVVVSQNPANPLEMAVTGGTPGQVIKIKTEAVEIGGGQSLGSDLCCMGEMTVVIPKDELCETPLDLSVEKVWHDFLDLSELDPSIAGAVSPHGFQVTVDLPTGKLEPGDVITVNDPAADQVGITGFGAPVAPAPWTCALSGQSWSCSYTVPATGAVLPVNIFWSAAKSPEDPAKNCATTEVTRNGSILGEITSANNRSCWTQNPQQDDSSDLSIAKSGPAQCRSGEPCQFTYTVSNDGTGDYNGSITLDDKVTNSQLSGNGNFSASGGHFSGITPPLCAVADLGSGAGCTGNASIPAGGSQTYTVTYSPPIFDGEGDFAIKNCVTMFDATMVPDEPGKESCHSTEITKPQLEIVKSGPSECKVGEACDFTVTINNTSSTAFSGPVLLSDTTTVSQFTVNAVTPTPPGCGVNLPANPFACVTNISLAAGASTSYTLSMAPLSAGGQVVAESGENCANLASLPQGTPEGDHSLQFYGVGTPTAPQSFMDLLQNTAPIGESCVPLEIKDPNEDTSDPNTSDTPSYTVEKTCSADPVGSQCSIVVTTNGASFTGNLTITDTLNIEDTSGVTIAGPIGTVCDNSTLTCTIDHATISGYTPANTVTFTVNMPASDQEGLMNCASGAHETMGTKSDCVLLDGEFDKPHSPPEVSGTCETDFIFVVDKSGSLNENANGNFSNGRANAVASAVNRMAKLAVGNGSQAAVVEFNSNASVTQNMSVGTLTNLANGYGISASGGTNWEAALIAADSIPNSGRPTIMYFITDGRPTSYVKPDGTNANLPDNAASWLQATNEAIPAVNALYAKGIKIIGVGASDSSGMFVSTYLDALLGGNTQGSSFNSLAADLGQSISDMCPNLLLSKTFDNSNRRGLSFSPTDPATKKMTVKLKVENPTSNPINSVVVEDLVPSDIPYAGNEVLSAGSFANNGQNFSWSIPTIAPGSSETVSFDVTVSKPDTKSCNYKTNYAQVTAVGTAIQSTPNNMNPSAGPVAETDEASAQYCAYLYERVVHDPCTINTLHVDKYPTFGEACEAGGPCEFEIKISQTCGRLGWDGPVFFGDQTSINGGAVIAPTITSITNDVSPSLCAYPSAWINTSQGRTCKENLVLPANASATFTVTMTGPPAGETYKNCFIADGSAPTPTDFSSAITPSTTPRGSPRVWGDCTTFEVSGNKNRTVDVPPNPEPDPKEVIGKPKITLVKSSEKGCSVNVASQRYTCDFQLEVKNEGDGAFSGPMVLDDVFGSPNPIAINNVSGDGWSCTENGLSGTSCINGALNLAPQQSSIVSMQLSLPGRRDGGRFENCGTIGVGSDETQQAMIAQTALNQIGFNVGGVDGKIGPKTRAALKDLQKQLGINPTGKVTPGFFKAIGLQMAAEVEPSCVTVDLPPMPSPPLVCQASTARKVGNKCACRAGFTYSKNRKACVPVCKEGSVYSRKHNKCIAATPKCRAGFAYNTKRKACVSICRQGSVYSRKRNKCIALKPKCRAGFAYNTKRKACVSICRQGSVYSRKHNKCIALKPKCRAGFAYNTKRKACVSICRQGSVYSRKRNKCIALKPKCRAGFAYNTKRKACVSICRQGSVYSRKRNKCIALKPKCRAGFAYNTKRKACVSICRQGSVYSRRRNKCIAPKPKCRAGFAYSKKRKACVSVCKPGLQYDRRRKRCIGKERPPPRPKHYNEADCEAAAVSPRECKAWLRKKNG